MNISLILIALTVVVTLIGWSQPKLQNEGMLWPYRAWHGRQWHTLLTSAFLHSNGMHLLFNMITFLFFGPALEGIIGPANLVLIYVLSALIAGLPSLYRHRNNPRYATLGASGAVSGILFSYILYMPMNRIFLFFIPIGIPAALFGLLYLAYTYWESRRESGIINHDAHLAGAIAGIVLTIILNPGVINTFLETVGIF